MSWAGNSLCHLLGSIRASLGETCPRGSVVPLAAMHITQGPRPSWPSQTGDVSLRGGWRVSPRGAATYPCGHSHSSCSLSLPKSLLKCGFKGSWVPHSHEVEKLEQMDGARALGLGGSPRCRELRDTAGTGPTTQGHPCGTASRARPPWDAGTVPLGCCLCGDKAPACPPSARAATKPPPCTRDKLLVCSMGWRL